jgi:hypothetical protein
MVMVLEHNEDGDGGSNKKKEKQPHHLNPRGRHKLLVYAGKPIKGLTTSEVDVDIISYRNNKLPR